MQDAYLEGGQTAEAGPCRRIVHTYEVGVALDQEHPDLSKEAHTGEYTAQWSQGFNCEFLQIKAYGRGYGERLRCKTVRVRVAIIASDVQALQTGCYLAESSEHRGPNGWEDTPGLRPGWVVKVQAEALPADQGDDVAPAAIPTF